MTKDSNSIIKDITIREINRNMKQIIGSNNMGKTIIINCSRVNNIENKQKNKKTINKIRINSNSWIKIAIKTDINIVRVKMSK